MLRIFLLALLFILNTPKSYADARLIVHLTDYLANDYSGAVSEERKVLNEFEFNEQKEFAVKVLEEGKKDPRIKENKELINSIQRLHDLIFTKEAPSLVVPLSRQIQKEVLLVSGISLSPSAWPSHKKAKAIFQETCIQCHGPEGRGDGPDGKDLDPLPTNFYDPERGPLVSPFAAFNTIRLGVPGTGMDAFTDLSDEEVWSLAFYVSSLRFGKSVLSREHLSKSVSNEEILAQVASSNDEQFKSYALLIGEEPQSFLKKVRLYDFESVSSDYLETAKSLLLASVKAFEAGDYDEAQKLSLEAYFKGIEPVENKISANDPSAVTRIEEHMSAFRKAIKDKKETVVSASVATLTEEINSLQILLGEDKITPTFAFVSGFSIILREGFEAVLVILAILGVAKAAASPVVTMAVHAGWIISLILGVIGWYISGILISISGASREVMEAVASFLAVFVLIYVGFWMHRQAEINRWKEFINVKVKNLTQTKNLLGLFALSFIVTFREVIETVLFLRTVYIDTGDDIKVYILAGVLVAFGIVLIVSVLITKFRNNIPLKRFFNLSSVLMMILATILVGKGMHSLQEADLVSLTVFPIKYRIELLGIFPSWESLGSQLIIFMTSLWIWKSAGKKSL